MQKSLLRKGLVVGIILLFFGASVIPSIGGTIVEKQGSIGNTLRGNTLYVGGSGPNNYTKIQDAIDNATDEDTVFVYNGTYYEHDVKVNKSITLIGEDKNYTIVNCENKSIGFLVNSDYVNITGFTIHRYNGEGISSHGNHSTISGNIITNGNRHSSAIQIEYSNHNIISSNIIINYSWGIALLYNCEYNTISYNYLKNSNDSGIVIMRDSDFNNVYMNIIDNSGADMAADGLYILSYCDSCNYSWNTVNNFYVGVHITKGDNNTVYMNNISNCVFGIEITGHPDTTSSLIQGRKPNNIKNNNLKRVIFMAFSKFFNNNYKDRWEGNFWGRPKIIPKIIIGFNVKTGIPVPARLEFDWHPAQKPYDIPRLSI